MQRSVGCERIFQDARSLEVGWEYERNIPTVRLDQGDELQVCDRASGNISASDLMYHLVGRTHPYIR